MKRGFTLIEMLVAVAIIIILVSIALAVGVQVMSSSKRQLTVSELLEVIESLCKDWCVGATIGTYLDWVIVGGESGPHARPFKLEWARNLRDQCRGSGVPFFAKQLGSNPLDCDVPGAADPKEHMRYHTDHRSGADPAEWPDDLRVQEFPR